MKLSLRPRAHALGCGLLLATLTGCAGPALSTPPPSPPGSRTPAVTPASLARFDEARAAYQRAVALCPDDLGLAVALRGPIVDDGDADARRAKIAAVRAEIDAAKRIDPQRPDAWFNEAVLIHELESRGESTADSIAALDRAAARFETFIARSAGKPEYAAAVVRARERLTDIDATKAFLGGSAPPPPPTPRRSP